MSKPWRKKKSPRAQVERQLAYLEATRGEALICFKEGCGKKALAMDECLTCEALAHEAHAKRKKPREIFKVNSCEDHRMEGFARIKKHALVRHPANLLRVVAAGLKGEEI